MQQKHILEVH